MRKSNFLKKHTSGKIDLRRRSVCGTVFTSLRKSAMRLTDILLSLGPIPGNTSCSNSSRRSHSSSSICNASAANLLIKFNRMASTHCTLRSLICQLISQGAEIASSLTPCPGLNTSSSVVLGLPSLELYFLFGSSFPVSGFWALQRRICLSGRICTRRSL